MENNHLMEISDHIKLKPAWLETFAGMKDDVDIPPSLMHEFVSNSEHFHTLEIHHSDDLNQNIIHLDEKHDVFYQNSTSLTHLDQNLDHFEQSSDGFDHTSKSDTKKHRRKASAPQRAVPKELLNSLTHDEIIHSSESSQDDLPLDSREFEKIKNEKLLKLEQILELGVSEELRYQKLSNLERLLNSEELNENYLLEDQVDQLISLENGDWKKFLNEFETQDIFKDLQEEGDGETLEGEIFSNVKEEFKAHWGIKCNMCESVFPYKTVFDKHYVSSYKTRPVYTCTFCDKSVDKYTTFRSHCYRHITEGRYKCKQCSKGFSLQSMLQVHILTKHTECKPFMCEECGRSFVTKPGLKIHLKKHKIELKEDYPCVECGKVLHTRGGLTSHMNVHRLGRRFMCDICGKTFTQKVNMQQHVKQHTGNKPHVCKTCGKGFAERSHLQRHLSFHSEDRPFKCPICNKMYKTERCLKVHSLVHAEARPYTCEVCRKGFLSSTKLKQHCNIHTGERPYKCKYCDRGFTNYPNWLKHTRRRHKVNHKTGEGLPDLQLQTKAITDLIQNNDKQDLDGTLQREVISPSKELKTEKEEVIKTLEINSKVSNLNDKVILSEIKVTKQQTLLTEEFSESEDTLDKSHLDIETNLMLDKNLDLDGKSLVLNHKSMIFNDVEPCLKTIDKLVSEKLIENMHLQNNLGESMLLNDVNLKSHDVQDSLVMSYPIFDNAKAVIGQQLEFLTGNTNSPVNTMTYLVPYLQNTLPNQTIIQNSAQNLILPLQINDLVSSNSLIQQSCE